MITGHAFGRGGTANESQELTDHVACLQVEGIVVAKIVKHCKECLPNFVTGQLLGLDIGSTLEVTYSFPFPVSLLACGEGIFLVFHPYVGAFEP